MNSSRNDSSSFRVQFSARVWSQVGAVPQRAFSLVKERLRELARQELSSEAGPATLRLRIEDYEAVCTIDGATRTVTLVDLLKAAASSSEPAP